MSYGAFMTNSTNDKYLTNMKIKILNYFPFVLTITTLILLTSCITMNPIIKKNIKEETINTNDTTTIKRTFDFFRISRYGFWGKAENETLKSQKGEIIVMKFYKRSTNKGICDGQQNFMTKIITYKDGRIYSKTIKISKHRGLGGTSSSKTIIYSGNGNRIEKTTYKNGNKKIKKYNNKKNAP